MINLSDNVRCFGNRYFNLFLVGKKQAALVECGVSGAVVNLAQQWKMMKEPRPKVEYLLAMHAHFDHICGIPGLKKMFPEAFISASAGAKKVLSKERIIKDFFDQDKSMSELLKNRGLIDGPAELPVPDAIDVSLVLSPGDKIYLDPGIYMEIIAAPGHSPDSLAAFLPSDRILFISDAAGFQISDQDIFPVFFQSYPIYMETLERLMRYPAAILALPHGSVWAGREVDWFFQRAKSAAENLFALVRDLSEKGRDIEYIHESLYQSYYRGDLQIYTQNNIKGCVELLVKRVQECL